MKYIKYFLVFSCAFSSCNKKEVVSPYVQDLSFKEILSKDSLAFLEFFDSSTNVYSNFYYGFTVNVPKGWDSDRGVSKNTVFRLTNYDSGIVFSVTVNKILSENKLPSDMWGPFLDDSVKYIRDFKGGIQDQLNSNVLDLELRKVYYVNQKALKSNYKYLFRSDELEYYMYSEMFQFLYKNNIFTVGLIIPKDFYDYNDSYKYLKNNFNLIPIKHE